MIFQVLGDLLFEGAATLGWESLKDSVRLEREATPVLAGLGHLLLGLAAGVVSLMVFDRRLTPASAIPGLSLIAAPLTTGAAMHGLGGVWPLGGRDRLALFTFRAGALFAFAMAVVRFVHLELQWRPL